MLHLGGYLGSAVIGRGDFQRQDMGLPKDGTVLRFGELGTNRLDAYCPKLGRKLLWSLCRMLLSHVRLTFPLKI